MVNYVPVDESRIKYYPIASVDEIPSGERIFIEVNGEPIVVFNIAGNFYAIGDVCTHDDGPLGDGRVEGFDVTCPRHGAHFDVRTGRALTLPAVADTPSYPMRVMDGQVEIGIPEQTTG